MWTLADSFGAIAFAGGFAQAVAALAAQHAPLFGCGLMLFAAAWRGFSGAAAQRAGASIAIAAKTALRARVVEAALRARPGDAAARGQRLSALDDVEALDGWFARYLPARFAAGLAPLVLLIAVFAASPLSGAILLGAFIPFLLIMALVGMTSAHAARRQLDALARLSGLFVDRVRALPLIFAYGAERAETIAIGRAADEARARTLSVLRVAFLSSATLEFFAALSVALAAVYIGFNLLGLLPFPVPEKLTLLRGMFVLALAPELYAPLRRLAAAYHDKQLGEAAAERLAALLAAPQVAAPAAIALARAPALRVRGAIIAHAEGPRLGPFDLDAAPGEITAVVGESGAGKTSLLSALLGLAPPAAGEVWADDVSLAAAGSFASFSAYAGQKPLVLPASIADNLRLAAPDASAADIDACAHRVGLGEALRSRGLDAPLDERGGGLSGGERRRLGFARALMKQAPLLLLDEPTADLDPEAEQDMIALIRSLRGQATVLLATHSPRLAAMADKVVTLA